MRCPELPRVPAPRRCRGSVALEFALVLPVFLLLLYGLILYALMFAAQHTLVQSAAEGARAALRYAATPAERELAACQVANTAAGWITAVTKHATSCEVSTDCSNAPCRRIRLSYDYGAHPLVPTPDFMSSFLPARLQSDAVVHLP